MRALTLSLPLGLVRHTPTLQLPTIAEEMVEIEDDELVTTRDDDARADALMAAAQALTRREV